MAWSSWHSLVFCASVTLYAVYVALWAVPRATSEMQRLVHEAHQTSEARWSELNQLAPAEGGAAEAAKLLKSVDDQLVGLQTRLREWTALAEATPQLVEEHVREFHSDGIARPRVLCFVAAEVAGYKEEELPLMTALEQMAGGHVPLEIYWASGDVADNATMRRRHQDTALASSGVRVRRVLCGGAASPLDCAAERAFADGAGYVVAAHGGWSLPATSLAWPEELVKGFVARGQLGAALLQGGAVCYGRTHFRVFGGRVSLGHGWARSVYGSELAWEMPGTELTVRGENVASDKEASAKEVRQWHIFLCREQRWPQYCGRADVRHFEAPVPNKEEDERLSREEFEKVEHGAKSDELDSVLAAQEALRTRRMARQKKTRETAAALRVALLDYGGVVGGNVTAMTDEEVREAVVAAVRDIGARPTSWEALWALSPEQLVLRARADFPAAAANNRLRVTLERLMRHRAVLPEGPRDLLKEARWILANVSGESAATALSEAKVEAALEGAWPKAVLADHVFVRTVTRTTTAAPMSPPPTMPPASSRRPCTVSGVTVPLPWFAVEGKEEAAVACYSEKALGEKCCLHTVGDILCMANFEGYSPGSMRDWMANCRTAGWMSEKSFVPGAWGGAGQMAGLERPCIVEGKVVPRPWHRRPETPEDECVAPKQRDEKCCEHGDGKPLCVARFGGYSAQAMEDWIKSCKRPHWK